MAKESGVAIVGMANMSHSGSIGYYTEMAAKEDLVAISFCQSDPMAVPFGGTEPYYGSYHEVDSSEMAFKIAGSMAFKEAMREADPVLLEPIMKVCVIVPDEYMGDVIGDLNARRGQIQGYEMRSGAQQIDAFVPLSEMFGYATNLRSRTQGRGQFTMEPSHYVELPKSLQEKLVSKHGGKDD